MVKGYPETYVTSQDLHGNLHHRCSEYNFTFTSMTLAPLLLEYNKLKLH